MKKYPGKNAAWFLIIIFVYQIIPLIVLMSAESFAVWLLIFLVIWYAFDFLLLPITFRNYVLLNEDHFVFVYGFSKETVDIKDIKKIEKTHSVLASSANSLDRILIETKGNTMMISLKDNDDFIKQIHYYMKNKA